MEGQFARDLDTIYRNPHRNSIWFHRMVINPTPSFDGYACICGYVFDLPSELADHLVSLTDEELSEHHAMLLMGELS